MFANFHTITAATTIRIHTLHCKVSWSWCLEVPSLVHLQFSEFNCQWCIVLHLVILSSSTYGDMSVVNLVIIMHDDMPVVYHTASCHHYTWWHVSEVLYCILSSSYMVNPSMVNLVIIIHSDNLVVHQVMNKSLVHDKYMLLLLASYCILSSSY